MKLYPVLYQFDTLKIYCFNFQVDECLLACMSVYHVQEVPTEARESIGFPETGARNGCEPLCMCDGN